MLRKDITPWESEQHNLFPCATDIVVFIQRLHNKFYIFWTSIIWIPSLRDFYSTFLYEEFGGLHAAQLPSIPPRDLS